MNPIFDDETRRRLILGEFLYRRPVFESYKSLCRKIGKDTISYQEFDFWFHRFAEGNMDLNYDRSLDPKPKELSDMPIEIVDNIVDHLGLVDRLTVRNVSQGLRALIDKRITAIKRISFNIWPDTCSVSVDDAEIFYKESIQRKTIQFNNHKEHVTSTERPKSIKNALIQLAHYLKNPNLKLKSLSIEIRKAEEFDDKFENLQYFFEKLESFLRSLNHQIHTECLWIRDVHENSFLTILKSLKPGVLEDITIMNEVIGLVNTEMMDEIVETNQWKQAKELGSFGLMVIATHGVAHFEEFSFCCYEVVPEDVISFVELLAESRTFRKAELEFHYWASVEQFVEAFGSRIVRDAENESKWIYQIPNTNAFLEFEECSENELYIRKVL